MELPYIGKIDNGTLDEYECYEAELPYQGSVVDIDLNFSQSTISDEDAAHLANVLRELPKYAGFAWKGIEKDWYRGEQAQGDYNWTRFYLEDHVDIFAELYPHTNLTLETMDFATFKSALTLGRIGIYPESDDAYLVCDIYYDREITDQILVVNINKTGQISEILTES